MSVCCGATVTESPVCTPIGSMFSIEQTITTLSPWSRITSSSNSPQPITDWSIRIWPIGEASRPWRTIRSNSSCVVGDAAAAAAEREGRADDRRQTGHLEELEGVGVAAVDVAVPVGLDRRLGDAGGRHLQPAACHGLGERLAVLGAVDRVVVRADQLDAVLVEGAVLLEGLGEVEGRLAAEGREQRVGALLLDDLRHDAREQRLDVRRVGELRSVMIVAGLEFTRTTS